MPTYDYRCRQCGHTIEVIHPMTEDGPTSCERCGGQLQRILHPAGIIFRGSGFYKTDSRSASSASVPAGPAKGGTTPDKGTGASGGGSKDTQGATGKDASPKSPND